MRIIANFAASNHGVQAYYDCPVWETKNFTDTMMTRLQLFLTLALFLCSVPSQAQTRHPARFKQMARSKQSEWFAGVEARQAADSAMRYQYPCGGWAKNHDWHVLENEGKM